MKKLKIKTDIVIVTFIVLMPFAFYLYLLAPYQTKIWTTSFFVIDAEYYELVRHYLWINFYLLTTLLVIAIWFLTCKYWWRYVLFVPLIFQVYQYLFFLNWKSMYYSGFNFYHSLLISIPILTLLHMLSKKMGYYSIKKNYKDELNKEIFHLMNDLSLFEQNDYLIANKQFEILKKKKNMISKRKYLSELLVLRDSFIKK
ncbi:MAG: hypothetical protein WA775_12690 [Psychroserpens sp.]|uniref:hypothetical protein n=1 Tax=Psychroserpens sp. TaxID=2020870 RepID=UPI003CBB9D89